MNRSYDWKILNLDVTMERDLFTNFLHVTMATWGEYLHIYVPAFDSSYLTQTRFMHEQPFFSGYSRRLSWLLSRA